MRLISAFKCHIALLLYDYFLVRGFVLKQNNILSFHRFLQITKNTVQKEQHMLHTKINNIQLTVSVSCKNLRTFLQIHFLIEIFTQYFATVSTLRRFI